MSATALLSCALGCAGGVGTGAPPEPPPHHGAVAPGPAEASETHAEGAPEARPPTGWPTTFVVGPGSGPALFLGPAADAPPMGYVSAGAQVELAGPPEGDRIPVIIPGDLEARGWLPLSRLAARIQERGRVAGAPGYVGPGDVVRVLGAADEGLMRIELRPPLREGHALPAMEAVYPAARLGARRLGPADAPGPNPGTPMALPLGQTVDVYDRPDGEVVASLPALDPPLRIVVLVENGPWKGVRVGTGPYLTGFIKDALTPAEAPEKAPVDPLAHARSDGPVPIRLMAEPDRPLWRLEAGARITFGDKTIGIAHEGALAREMARHGATDQVDVFVAQGDTVAVRGMVDTDALKTAEGVAPAQGASGGD
jgi:hypothetical protein